MDQIATARWDFCDLPEKLLPSAFVLTALQKYQLDFCSSAFEEQPCAIQKYLKGEEVAMIEAISQIKKCNTMGRAQLAFDLKFLENQLENWGVHYKFETADIFIKAFYLTEQTAFAWIVKHRKKFSRDQIKSVLRLGVGQTMRKQAFLFLLEAVDELCRN